MNECQLRAKISIFPCHVEPVETSSRKAHICFSFRYARFFDYAQNDKENFELYRLFQIGCGCPTRNYSLLIINYSLFITNSAQICLRGAGFGGKQGLLSDKLQDISLSCKFLKKVSFFLLKRFTKKSESSSICKLSRSSAAYRRAKATEMNLENDDKKFFKKTF